MTAPRFIKISQAPAMYGPSRATIYRWIAADYIKKYKVGGVAMLSVAEMDAFIERGQG